MARFVLIHGAFTGAWVWKPLKDRLLATGHSAEVFDLPGSGEDKTTLSRVTLESSAACLREILTAKIEPAIVVSHSMGGIVATQAAVLCPEHISALVYVASFLPRNGQSLLDLTKFPEAADDGVQANMKIDDEWLVGTMPNSASRNVLYGSCSETLAAWAISQQQPQPLALFKTPVDIPDGVLDEIKQFYVVCTRDRAIPPMMQRRMAIEAGAAVHELNSDHTPHLCQTDALAEILKQIAGA